MYWEEIVSVQGILIKEKVGPMLTPAATIGSKKTLYTAHGPGKERQSQRYCCAQF